MKGGVRKNTSRDIFIQTFKYSADAGMEEVDTVCTGNEMSRWRTSAVMLLPSVINYFFQVNLIILTRAFFALKKKKKKIEN